MYSGLSSEQVKIVLKQQGSNEITVKHASLLDQIGKHVISPISCMLMLASILSFVLGKIFDGNFILFLLVLNMGITIWQEHKADKAIQKLNEHLQQYICAFRDGSWKSIEARLLVPGDMIKLSSGEIVPADATILEAHNLMLNESALSGESLPKAKTEGDSIFSGSYVDTGIAIVKITATGIHTHFGKTMISVERVRKKSLLESDIISISRFLTILSIGAVVVLTIIFLIQKKSFLEIITLDLSLVIAGIPISLPTVMTLIIEFGIVDLAKKNVIVRRLSALEDMANVNFLLTDKTGTLTKNKITVHDVFTYHDYTPDQLLTYAAMIAPSESDNSIDRAILKHIHVQKIEIPEFKLQLFTPADSTRKRSTCFVVFNQEKIVVSLGAPQIIQKYCDMDASTNEQFQHDVAACAEDGYRTLALAKGTGEKEEQLEIVGLLALSDTLRSDAKSVIAHLKENGLGISMVTGDNHAIAKNIAHQLVLDHGVVVTRQELEKKHIETLDKEFFYNTAAFAEVLPEDKFRLVEQAKHFFIVAATGDGINDLPAIKAAQVGIAVKNAVTALKSTADIVLLSAGISVIKDAVVESRYIFERIYIYSLYRISESFRLIVTIALLGLLYGDYPMTALQIIILALLNDIPIISLAFDRVHTSRRPAKIDAKQRFILSSLYGTVGVINSMGLFLLMRLVWHLDWAVIQTMFFLKLTVSGHLLIYVAHTKQRWWKFLPSREVMISTTITQLIATGLAFTGFLMSGRLTVWQIVFIWVWAFFWMQVSEGMKFVRTHNILVQ